MCNVISFLQGASLGLSPLACSVHNVFTEKCMYWTIRLQAHDFHNTIVDEARVN